MESAGWSVGRRKLVVHIDNASADTSRMTHNFFGHNPLKTLSCLPYSSDISPSDSYIFGKVKTVLIGREILDEIDLLEAVTEILNGISDGELQRVFRNWIERVEMVINTRGDSMAA
jgi:hypothetical protein